MNLVAGIGESLSVYKKDKILIFLSMIPTFFGGVIYYFLGHFMYTVMLGKGKEYIASKITLGDWGKFLEYTLIALLTIVLYFVVSWTFVFIVSLISCPFNDMISTRVENVICGKSENISTTFSNMMKNVFKTIKTEIKKISMIILISIVGISLSLIPVLVPVSIFISAILLAVAFLDYSWSRNSLSAKECISDIRSSFFTYGISGLVFLTLITIPVLNLIIYPFAVVYYSVLYATKRKV